MQSGSFSPISEQQLLHSLYTGVLLLLFLPPFIGGTLMAVAGFYPLPEFYLIFTNVSVIYVATVMAIVLYLVPRAHQAIVKLTRLPVDEANKKTSKLLSHLHWYVISAATLYSILGAYSADLSLENMGYAQYDVEEHLYHQFGIIPVVLLTAFPVFFYMIDQLGRYLAPRGIQVNAIPLWTKMLMLGIVTPLLIDSLLIGYFYNRTGFFSLETGLIWFSLLVLAIGGTWLAWRSVQQGLTPLTIYAGDDKHKANPEKLEPLSLDELGILTARFAELTQSLKDEHEYSDSIINTAPVIILMLDPRGYIEFVNPWFETLTGYKNHEVKGKEWFATFLPEQDRDKIRELFHKATHDEPTRGNINSILARDGKKIEIEWYSQPLNDADGALLSLLNIGQDVTQRMQTEKSLREQKDQYHSLLETLPHGVQENDLTGTITYSNPAHAKMFGYTPEQMIGKKIWDILPAAEQAGFQQYFAELVEQRPATSSFSAQNLHRDGHVVDVSVDWDYQYDDAGELRGFISIITDLTARKQAEQSLKHQEALLDSFFVQSIDGCFFMMLDESVEWNEETDKDKVLEYVFSHQKITRVNDAMLAQYGADRNDFLGLTPSDLMAHDLDYGKQVWRQMFDAGRLAIKTEEEKFDGSVMWVEGEYVCLYDDQGCITGHFGVQREVTDEKRMEDELRNSAARLNEAQAIAAVGSWELDLATNQLHWTDQIYNLFELNKQEFEASYEAFLNAIHPDDREMVNQAYNNSLETREPYQIIHRLLMKDGRIKWVEERCTTDFADDGTPLSSRGTVQEITQRHNLEQQLREANDQLEQRVIERSQEVYQQNRRNQAILETTPDGFFSADMQGHINYANPAFCQLLGYSETELTALDIADIEASEDPAEVAAHIKRVHDNGFDRFETHHRHKDGRLVDVEISVALVDIQDEKMFYAFARDISERKENEQALIIARDEAQRANEAKSDFLSNMSHELRTPLNAILGFGQLLQIDTNHPLNDKQSSSLEEIMHAGEHLLSLVNEVLDLSRIESGYMDIKLKDTELAPVAEWSVVQLMPLAKQRGIRIDSEVSETDFRVMADEKRLKQVFLNLLSNAIKYNRDNGAVRLSCALTKAGRIRVNIEDTGRGIPADKQSKVFAPFERLGTAYDGIDGTGIGLALMKKHIEGMGGEVGLNSAEGVGSTFWFELNASPNTQFEQSEKQSEASSKAPSITVLYVEDNLSNLRLVRDLVSMRENCMLLEAIDAETGLVLAEREQPKLILMDINLPGMDGFQALQKLRENPGTASIPVVAVTANAMQSDIEHGKEAGFNDYLTKPLDMGKFNDVLDQFLLNNQTTGMS